MNVMRILLGKLKDGDTLGTPVRGKEFIVKHISEAEVLLVIGKNRRTAIRSPLVAQHSPNPLQPSQYLAPPTRIETMFPAPLVLTSLTHPACQTRMKVIKRESSTTRLRHNLVYGASQPGGCKWQFANSQSSATAV